MSSFMSNAEADRAARTNLPRWITNAVSREMHFVTMTPSGEPVSLAELDKLFSVQTPGDFERRQVCEIARAFNLKVTDLHTRYEAWRSRRLGEPNATEVL